MEEERKAEWEPVEMCTPLSTSFRLPPRSPQLDSVITGDLWRETKSMRDS